MRVWLPGEPGPGRVADLAHDPEFARLDWVGLVANGRRKCTFYVDDIELRPVRPP
jgi:hypothetical protein